MTASPQYTACPFRAITAAGVAMPSTVATRGQVFPNTCAIIGDKSTSVAALAALHIPAATHPANFNPTPKIAPTIPVAASDCVDVSASASINDVTGGGGGG